MLRFEKWDCRANGGGRDSCGLAWCPVTDCSEHGNAFGFRKVQAIS